MNTFKAFALAASFALVGSAAYAETPVSSAPTQSTSSPSYASEGLYTGRSIAAGPAKRYSTDGNVCGLDVAAICVQ